MFPVNIDDNKGHKLILLVCKSLKLSVLSSNFRNDNTQKQNTELEEDTTRPPSKMQFG